MSAITTPAVTTFADRLKQARTAKGWKRNQLAAMINAVPMSVTEWESGRKSPRITTLVDLCKCLGVSADWLLGLSEMGGPAL